MNETVKFIAKHKVVVICRGLYDNELIKTIRALYDDGIRVAEVALDQADPDAAEEICGAMRIIKEHFPRIKVRNGTVTCVKHVLATKKTGGEFCLSPDVNTEVIRATKEVSPISIPGAMTSTETLQAHNAEADIMKIFPVGWLGLSYLKDVEGSINHVKFLAAVGINEENFKKYLNAGHYAASISDRFIDRKVIAEGNFEELARRARMSTDIANACQFNPRRTTATGGGSFRIIPTIHDCSLYRR